MGGCGNASVQPGDAGGRISEGGAGSATQAAPLPDAHARSQGAADALDATAPDAVVAGATWTAIYGSLLSNASYPSNCTGSACHDPGIQKGIDLSSQAKGYTSIRTQLIPGAPDTSTLVIVLQSGAMPRGRPQMPAADLDLIRAWIQAGAPNN
jgi:hypothetical protein